MSQDNAPVWFITGCSTGFGREIAQQVLDRGWRAVVTARDPGQVQDMRARRKGHLIVTRFSLLMAPPGYSRAA